MAKRKHFDPTNIAALIPGESAKQVDVMGRPLKIGDRVDDTTEFIGGVIVSIFGETAIFIVDYDSGFGMGRFCSQACSELRLLPTPGNVTDYVRDLLTYRDVVIQEPDPHDDRGRKEREAEDHHPQRTASLLTRLEPGKCLDKTGRRIEIGDVVLCTEDANSPARGGRVVSITADLIVIESHDEQGRQFDPATASGCIVQPAAMRQRDGNPDPRRVEGVFVKSNKL